MPSVEEPSMNQKKIVAVIIKMEKVVLLCLGIGATLAMFGNAVGRYVFQHTFVWAEESIRILFVWGMFIAITDAFLTNDHIGFQNLTNKTVFTRYASDILYNLVLLFVGLILSWYGGRYNKMTGNVPLTGTGLPTAVFMIPGIVAGFIWSCIGAVRVVLCTRKYLCHGYQLRKEGE